MPVPGFDDPALSSRPPAGDLFFAPAAGLAVSKHEVIRGGGRSSPAGAQSLDASAPSLMFGSGKYTSDGEVIVHSSKSVRGHYSEILNFHGSPAPWILIGILLVAGMLHLSAEGKFGFGGRV